MNHLRQTIATHNVCQEFNFFVGWQFAVTIWQFWFTGTPADTVALHVKMIPSFVKVGFFRLRH